MSDPKPNAVDVLVVGGGPAGLSAALMLSRAVYTTIVFDSGIYRNSDSHHMHVVPTWDHSNPAQYREAARAELKARYGQLVNFVDQKVIILKKHTSGNFLAVDATGLSWIGKKVILAIGNRDVFPAIDGYADCWIKGIFHCLFCHGYEDRGVSTAGVLAVDLLAKMHFHNNSLARNALQFTKEGVTIYTNGSTELASAIKPMVEKQSRITIDTRTIIKLVKGPNAAEVILHFNDGNQKTEGFLVHTPWNCVDIGFAKELNLEIDPTGLALKVYQPWQEGTEPGVFVAGDASSYTSKMVIASLTSGGYAASGVIRQLQAD